MRTPRALPGARACHAPADLGGGASAGEIVAVLGPTNTGKTHHAIERMLGHASGVIGFPLRLLAREVYDRVVAMRGPGEVALVTGEEKIVPPRARYWLSTVEAMPLDFGADFVAVDEIQLAADPERGHVFTDRLMRARGRRETMFLGAATMRDRIAALAPGARFVFRERLSKLSWAGPKKLSRMPARSAIVAFSAEDVYAIAELIRRQKGGAAVVLGALSPRTRNAQVALYQEGDVDYLVATDAIGMGLNLDVHHVAFAGLTKFDGRRRRMLEPAELAQIAGRAGRYTTDGSFGVTGEASALSDETVAAIEAHAFAPVTKLEWRSARLDFATPATLVRSLEAEPTLPDLRRARDADDLLALRALAADPDIAERTRGRAAVALLWDVAQVPDFRKTMPAEHAQLLGQLYRFLTADAGVVPEDWLTAQVARVDRVDGEIDTLSKRLAYVRTWTYVANRNGWLRDAEHWRGRTRDIEDRLSDALHARLTQRFVDRRTSVLARRLKQKETLLAEIDDRGVVSVEGHEVGRLDGFRFQPDPTAGGHEGKTLQAAAKEALASEIARRVERFYGAPDTEIDVTHQGGMMWGDAAVGRLASRMAEGGDPLALKAIAFVDEGLDPALEEKVVRRLQFWIDRKVQAAFEPLIALRDDPTVVGLARGVAFRLLEWRGLIPRSEIAEDVKALDQDSRGKLRKHGVRFGQHTVFVPTLLKPAATRLRMLMWGLADGLDEIPTPPPPGLVTIPVDPEASWAFYAMAGYRPVGARALRLDMLERLADMIRPMDARAGFEATPEMLSITGSTLEQFVEMMDGLGYVAEKGERPKAPKSPKGAKPGVKAEPSEPATPEAEVAEPEAEVAMLEAEATAPEVELAAPEAEVVEPQTVAASDEPTAAEPTSAEPTRTAEPTAETASAVEDAAPSEPTVSEAAGTPAEPAATPDPEAAGPAADVLGALDESAATGPVELETFFLFRVAPRRPRFRREADDGAEGGRRSRGPRRDGRGAEQGEGAGDGQGQRHGRGQGRGAGRAEGGERPWRRGQSQGAGQGHGVGQGQGPSDGRAASRGEARGPGEAGPDGARVATEGGGGRFRRDAGGDRGPRGPRDDRGRGDGPRREGGGYGGGGHGGGGSGGGGYGQGGGGREPRREPRIDPDSPFAILQKLKEKP